MSFVRMLVAFRHSCTSWQRKDCVAFYQSASRWFELRKSLCCLFAGSWGSTQIYQKVFWQDPHQYWHTLLLRPGKLPPDNDFLQESNAYEESLIAPPQSALIFGFLLPVKHIASLAWFSHALECRVQFNMLSALPLNHHDCGNVLWQGDIYLISPEGKFLEAYTLEADAKLIAEDWAKVNLLQDYQILSVTNIDINTLIYGKPWLVWGDQ